MSSRDVSTVKIMRVRPFIISLVCVGLVLLFCVGAEAKDESGVKTVAVNCAQGGSINNALKEKADELVIEIRGMCREDVVISRNNVTLRGVDPNATVVAQSARAIWIDRASRVTLESLTVRGSTGTTGPTGAGIFVERSTGLTISNVKAKENFEGMRTYGSSLRIVDSDFSGNRSGGLYIGNGSSLIIDGDEINVSNNGVYGLCLSESTLRSTWIAYPRVLANDNGVDGYGVWVQGRATAFLGPLEAKRNRTGIFVVGGSLSNGSSLDASDNGTGVFAFGPDAEINLAGSVSRNTGTGLQAMEGAYISFSGTLTENGNTGVAVSMGAQVWLSGTECRDNGFGVKVHGGTASIDTSTIQGNTIRDVDLSFGARVSFGGVNEVGTFACDDTVLVEGLDVSCPATTSVTVSPLQIERVAPKSRHPGNPKAPRWIP